MHKRIRWCATLGWITASALCAADGGPSTKMPDADYSADRVIRMEDGGHRMELAVHVNYARGKERDEMEFDGRRTVTILRHDQKLAWMILSDQRLYMETDYGKRAEYCHWPCVNFEKGKGYTKLGDEMVNGIGTTEYKMVCVDRTGKTIEGLFWVAANGIVAKMDFTAAGKGGNPRHAVIELRNLKLGGQDASLFEIPAGYSKMSMPGLPLGGMPAGGPGVKDILRGLPGH